MPARPHRTVDRVTAILETVSLTPQGVTLAELATALDAAKSSVQELTNGLLARGYLVEDDGRFHLGPGPFISSWPPERTSSPPSPSTTGSSSS
jgi:DNA-binding IclR family transcriptional regulator